MLKIYLTCLVFHVVLKICLCSGAGSIPPLQNYDSTSDRFNKCCKDLITSYTLAPVIETERALTQEACLNKLGQLFQSVQPDEYFTSICNDCLGKTVTPDDPFLLMKFQDENDRDKLLTALEVNPESNLVSISDRSVRYLLSLPNQSNQILNEQWWKSNLRYLTSETVFEMMYCQSAIRYQKYCSGNFRDYELDVDNCRISYTLWVLEPYCRKNNGTDVTNTDLTSTDFMKILMAVVKDTQDEQLRSKCVKKIIRAAMDDEIKLTITQLRGIISEVNTCLLPGIDDISVYPESSVSSGHTVITFPTDKWSLKDGMKMLKNKCVGRGNDEEKEIMACSAEWIKLTVKAQSLFIHKDIIWPTLATLSEDSMPYLNSLIKLLDTVYTAKSESLKEGKYKCYIDASVIADFFLIGFWDLDEEDHINAEALDTLLKKFQKGNKNSCNELKAKLETALNGYKNACGEKKFCKFDVQDNGCRGEARIMWNVLMGESFLKKCFGIGC